MDPRTFLPGAPTTPATVPAVGEPARELPVELDGRPTVVVFLRHVGCPFAEATFRAAHELAAADPGTRWIAVSHGSREATAEWCEAVSGGAGVVELVVDPDRAAYAAWGLGRTSLGHFLGRRSLGEVVRLSRQGIRNRHPSGTRWQSAGTFGVDAAGTIRSVHVPRHAGDLPDLQAAAAATRR